jgi:hypothetical protein
MLQGRGRQRHHTSTPVPGHTSGRSSASLAACWGRNRAQSASRDAWVAAGSCCASCGHALTIASTSCLLMRSLSSSRGCTAACACGRPGCARRRMGAAHARRGHAPHARRACCNPSRVITRGVLLQWRSILAAAELRGDARGIQVLTLRQRHMEGLYQPRVKDQHPMAPFTFAIGPLCHPV